MRAHVRINTWTDIQAALNTELVTLRGKLYLYNKVGHANIKHELYANTGELHQPS